MAVSPSIGYAKRPRPEGAVLLKVELLKRGLTYRDLAQKLGVKPQRVANLMSSWESWPLKRAVNLALNRRIFLKPKGAHRNKEIKT